MYRQRKLKAPALCREEREQADLLADMAEEQKAEREKK